MKQLFTIDSKDYDPAWEKFYRPSVRGIILNKNHEIALIYSQKFHIYKFPGGGIEPGEDHLTALAREINEETGMTLIPESVQEFGEVLRIQGSGKIKDTILIQENYYYLCQTTGEIHEQHLDESEKAADFILKFVTLDEAIAANSDPNINLGPFDQGIVDRECRVLELVRDSIDHRQTSKL